MLTTFNGLIFSPVDLCWHCAQAGHLGSGALLPSLAWKLRRSYFRLPLPASALLDFLAW